MNISHTNLLCILFVGLKLTGFIHWSWIWVLAPLWIPVLIGIGVAATVVFSSPPKGKGRLR